MGARLRREKYSLFMKSLTKCPKGGVWRRTVARPLCTPMYRCLPCNDVIEGGLKDGKKMRTNGYDGRDEEIWVVYRDAPHLETAMKFIVLVKPAAAPAKWFHKLEPSGHKQPPPPVNQYTNHINHFRKGFENICKKKEKCQNDPHSWGTFRG